MAAPQVHGDTIHVIDAPTLAQAEDRSPVRLAPPGDALVTDMPGVGPDSVAIDVHDNHLTLRGTVTVEGEKERLLLQEYGVGDYSREFTLGRLIDQTKIEASMKHGVLTLTLPKAEAIKPRKISVKTS